MIRASILITSLFLFVAGSSANDEKDGEVLVLTEATFDKAIETYNNIFVVFYIPNCGAYDAIEWKFKEAAKRLANEGSSIKFAKLECSQTPLLRIRYNIRYSPSLRFFKNKQISSYNGNRNPDALIAFVKAQAA